MVFWRGGAVFACFEKILSSYQVIDRFPEIRFKFFKVINTEPSYTLEVNILAVRPVWYIWLSHYCAHVRKFILKREKNSYKMNLNK